MSSENRLHPRIPVSIQVTLTDRQQQSVEAKCCNLSMGGVLLETDNETQARLLKGKHPDSVNEFELELPLPDQDKPLLLQARAVHIRRLAQQVFHIGLKFIQLDDVQRSQLEKFITPRL